MDLLRIIFGKGMKYFYENFYYNRNSSNYLKSGTHIMLQGDMYTAPTIMELDSYTRIQPHVRVIGHKGQKVILKKYSAISAGCTIVPGEHTPTVGIPQYLSYLGINDVNNTITINEDVWVGTNSTLLYKADIGRGAIIGANSLVTKKIPPYAVVAGAPAKIVAVRFSLEQIIEHEKILYPENERLDIDYLTDLFRNTYAGLKVIGTSRVDNDDMILLNHEKAKLGIKNFSLQ